LCLGPAAILYTLTEIPGPTGACRECGQGVFFSPDGVANLMHVRLFFFQFLLQELIREQRMMQVGFKFNRLENKMPT
jgi:hypothetical protein